MGPRKKGKKPARRKILLEDLLAAPYNPRQITDQALDGLEESIEQFGDLSGIVWNERSGHLVCGHQRLKALRQRYGEDLTLDFGPAGACLMAGAPTDGNTATAFPVRVVDWPESKEKAANIAANNPHIAGTFDDDKLKAVLDELQGDPDLQQLMEPLRLDELTASIAGGHDGADTSPQLGGLEYRLVVRCRDEQQQAELLEEMEKRGLQCQALMS